MPVIRHQEHALSALTLKDKAILIENPQRDRHRFNAN